MVYHRLAYKPKRIWAGTEALGFSMYVSFLDCILYLSHEYLDHFPSVNERQYTKIRVFYLFCRHLDVVVMFSYSDCVLKKEHVIYRLFFWEE